MLHRVCLFYCIHSDVLPVIKMWSCCICPVSKVMSSGFLWHGTCVIEGITVSLHQYSSGILDCGHHSLIENHGFLTGTHCSNLASTYIVFDLLTQIYTQYMYRPVHFYKYTGLWESNWSCMLVRHFIWLAGICWHWLMRILRNYHSGKCHWLLSVPLL